MAKVLPDLIEPFDAGKIDCAAYTLSIGREVYVTPAEDAPDPTSKSKRALGIGEAFTIPAGQFAFLLTEEIVTVPHNALAFISIRARIKFRGLVNVSGFHVDPGFKGRLVFSVFNAGPSTIHIQQGQECFLIWYANLDQESAEVKNGAVQLGISPELVSNISRQLHSIEGLATRIDKVEHEQNVIRLIGVGIATMLVTIVVTVVATLLANWVWEVPIFRNIGHHVEVEPARLNSTPASATRGNPTSPTVEPQPESGASKVPGSRE